MAFQEGEKMRTLNVVFTDEEYKFFEKKKDKSGLNWHDFILSLVGIKNGSV